MLPWSAWYWCAVCYLLCPVFCVQIPSAQSPHPGPKQFPMCNISLVFQVRRSLFAVVGNQSTLLHEAL